MNKTQVKKLLVEERKSMRVKQKQSKFMQKTASIYRGQVKRAAAEAKIELPYTLEEFRGWWGHRMIDGCAYTRERLTFSNVAVDHADPISRGGAWELDNLRLCTQSANWQKGRMNEEEFIEFLLYLGGNLAAVIADDIKRRLSTGGKWLAKRF